MKLINMGFFILFCFYRFLSAENIRYPENKVILYLSGYEKIKGVLRLNMFTNSNGFPDDYLKAYYYISYPVKKLNEVLVISNIPYGKYGISVFQDVNNNHKLDKNFFGVPVEPYGFSNNARGTFGPPDFLETVFFINKPEVRIYMKLK